jgi:hypothetical protein
VQSDYPAVNELPNAVAQIVNQRFADRPPILHRQNVRADDLAIRFGQFFQPFPHRLIARVGLEKDDFERAFSFHLSGSVSKMIRLSNCAADGWFRAGKPQVSRAF